MTTQRPFWFGQLHPLALIVPVAFVQVVFTFGAAVGQHQLYKVNALTIALALASAGALYWRRTQPIWVLVAVYALLTTYFVLDFPFGPVFISIVVALFNAVACGPRLAAWVTGYAGAVVLYSAMTFGHENFPFSWAGVGAVFAWISLVMGLGEVAKARRDRLEQAAVT